MKYIQLFLFIMSILLFATCKKEGCTDPDALNYDRNAEVDDGSCAYSEPRLIFKFKLDANQERLDNFGIPKAIPEGHAAQTPDFNQIGVHYIELSEQGDIPAYNGNKRQGYWAFETDLAGVAVIEGQAPLGATTVPNPLFTSSAIPLGSCLVTGQFDANFEITGTETEDIVIVCSISINNSFEWVDNNNNNTFEPTEGDVVVDMGVRWLIPFVE